uniref:chondroitin proteoglycan 2-like n=1 Tax=Gasterosteus aculeatus aculeatus TaxID=481459 RepID=UPI001A994FD7|nr:chondroitin proteoglycan 2-like [Gasterosteus aculeatus aculeatus]XP_040026231.1 chondroitin proteoglycan 2-like [Gasterosteus aculeatus aculeatus]
MCKLTLTAALCLIIASLGLPGIEAMKSSTDPCDGRPNGQYPNPDDEHSFLYCISGEKRVQQCPANLVYNPSIKVCDYPSSQTGNPCHGRRDGQYRNRDDRNSFLSCVAGLTYVLQCPADLVYRRRINQCVYPRRG